jgi:hypothetical protein
MELSKKGFINLHLDTDPLTKNFKIIEEEFINIHSLINTLKGDD